MLWTWFGSKPRSLSPSPSATKFLPPTTADYFTSSKTLPYYYSVSGLKLVHSCIRLVFSWLSLIPKYNGTLLILPCLKPFDIKPFSVAKMLIHLFSSVLGKRDVNCEKCLINLVREKNLANLILCVMKKNEKRLKKNCGQYLGCSCDNFTASSVSF